MIGLERRVRLDIRLKLLKHIHAPAASLLLFDNNHASNAAVDGLLVLALGIVSAKRWTLLAENCSVKAGIFMPEHSEYLLDRQQID